MKKYDGIYLEDNSKCLVCGGSSQKNVGIRGNKEYFNSDINVTPHLVTTVVECGGCGLTYCNPAFSGAEKIEGIHYGSAETYVFYGNFDLTKRFSKRIDILEKHVIIRSGADVGSGRGEFTNLLAERGFSVFGVEPSKGLAEYSMKIHGLDIKNTYLEELNLVDSLGFITSIHSLEHMSNPHGFIKESHKALNDDGVLFIELPNGDAAILSIVNFIMKLIGRSWNVKVCPLHAPFHHRSYNLKSLSRLLELNSFEVIESVTFSGADRGHANYKGYKSLLGMIKYHLTRVIDTVFQGECLAVVAKKVRHTNS